MKNTQKRKKSKNHQNSTYEIFFLQNRTKTKMEKIAFCVITFEPIKIQTHSAPQNDRLNFSFVKDIHVYGGNLAWNSCKTAICQSTFFMDTLYISFEKYCQMVSFFLWTLRFHEIFLWNCSYAPQQKFKCIASGIIIWKFKTICWTFFWKIIDKWHFPSYILWGFTSFFRKITAKSWQNF